MDVCERCAQPASTVVSQGIVGDRLVWSVSVRCGTCGETEVECGRDEMPGLWRELLIADVGTVVLRAEPGPGKARLLRMFREQGATLDEAVAAYRVLTSDGLEGTPAEMELLAARVDAAGGGQAFRRSVWTGSARPR